MFKHLLESVKVEAISYVFFVNFAEEGVVFEAAEPVDPPVLLVRTIRIRL